MLIKQKKNPIIKIEDENSDSHLDEKKIAPKISTTDRNLKSAYPANNNLNRNYNYTGMNFNNNNNNNYQNQNQSNNVSGPSINNSIQLNNINVISSVIKSFLYDFF